MALDFDCMSSLLCQEDGEWEDEVACSSFVQDKAETLKSTELATLPDFPVEDDEMISLLVQKEKQHLPREDYVERYLNCDFDVVARGEAINWIHEVQRHNNLTPLTTYLSVNYLDRFLSSYQSKQGISYPLQLLLVACLSLAAKMEDKDPPLIDLQVGDFNFDFKVGTIYELEVKILTTLKWRLCSITPFNFIHYLFFTLQHTKALPQALISRTIAFILNTTRVIDFSVHPPSSIAVAAVMCACEEVLPTEAAYYKEVILSSKVFDKDKITTCYNLMHQLMTNNRSTSNKISSDRSHTATGVEEAATFITSETSQSTKFSKRRMIYENMCSQLF